MPAANDKNAKLRLTFRLALYSVLFNASLVGIKYGLSKLSGSAALRADAVHSLADVVASASLLVGLHISRHRSPRFPYGLYKIENLASVVLSIMIFVAAYELGRGVIEQAATTGGLEPLGNLPLTLAGVTAVTIAIFAFSRYERRVALHTNSPALRADAADYYVDVLASGAIIVGLLLSVKGWNIDWLVTLFIVLVIARTGWEIMVEGVRVLLDASVEREVLNQVEAVIMQQPEVVCIRSLRGRNSGSFRFIEAVLVLNVHDLDVAHDISRRIEDSVRQVADNVDDILIHYEPATKQQYIYAFPVDEDGGISLHFGEAPQFLLVTVRAADNCVIAGKRIGNPFMEIEHGKGINVAEMLVEEDVDKVFTRESLHGKGPYYVFRQARVQMVHTEAEEVTAALELAGVTVPPGVLH